MSPSQDDFVNPNALHSSSAPPSSTSMIIDPQSLEHPGPSIVRTCLPCRRKHAKCDGVIPCSRCKSASDCVYVPRRRKSRSLRQAPSPVTDNRSRKTVAAHPAKALPATQAGDPSQDLASQDRADDARWRDSTTIRADALDLIPLNVWQHEGQAPRDQIDPYAVEDSYLGSFYSNFYLSHPFLLPKTDLLRVAKRKRLEPLFAAMRWIGSLYLKPAQSFSESRLFGEAYQLTYDPSYSKDGFMVQAMMLITIGLDGMWRQDSAKQVLADAEKIALDISLNTEAFAVSHGEGSSVLEESWRRTWWDLFVLDGIFAGVHRSTSFPLFHAPSDVAVPCEEHQYLSGNIPKSVTVSSLEDCDFSENSQSISSFGYRILVIRILGKLMQVPHIYNCDDTSIARVESLLTNWHLHLPVWKSQCLQDDGTEDEMMFQAYMIFHLTSILLHLPHSQIRSAPISTITSCAPRFDPGGTGDFNVHTQHAIQSARDISNMITFPVSLLKHSPLFCCIITLSSIVHLGKLASPFPTYEVDDTRQHIRLNLGAFTTMAKVWETARESGRQLKAILGEL